MSKRVRKGGIRKCRYICIYIIKGICVYISPFARALTRYDCAHSRHGVKGGGGEYKRGNAPLIHGDLAILGLASESILMVRDASTSSYTPQRIVSYPYLRYIEVVCIIIIIISARCAIFILALSLSLYMSFGNC